MSEDKAHRPAQGDQREPDTLTPPTPTEPVPEAAPANVPTDRTELLARARAFLTSPQIRLQDSDAKRVFLAEKGLAVNEIDQLLRELVRNMPPPVPPRTYPTPPPSNLPNLFIGVARIFTWLTGTSAVALFIYYWYLLPRLTQSYQARLALSKHQSGLVARLTESASALKAAQAESFKDLPRPVPVYEDSQYVDCHTIDDVLSCTGSSAGGSGEDTPDITILRCALEELFRTKEDSSGISTEELFQYLETKLPWLSAEEGAARQSELWNQLNTCPLFTSSMPKSSASLLPPDHRSRLLWQYTPPPPPSTPPMLTSLVNLQAALPRNSKVPATDSKCSTPAAPTLSAAQRTLQVLSDFTGYITTQTYSLGISSTRGVNGVASRGNPVEDELRREIRALKGLVLNRRSFLPPSVGVARPVSEPPRVSGA
ncbi:hypothetical protein PAXINDRAFT_108374 [Paxillus involutus ATCC 200175]|nr:hypothetical protein PAXINDRAFT_108374 [Paxillus involutus ATCC 200175]